RRWCAAAFPASAVGSAPPRRRGVGVSCPSATARARPQRFRVCTRHAALSARISEPGGYFDSDNLISNESSYLHVLGGMRRLGVAGGAYIGVGPDQNFSYIGQIRPHVAFIIDIRRDNLLQHLMFKALFEMARNRVEYLALLTGRAVPNDVAKWNRRSVNDIVEFIEKRSEE